jgi:hypothetical protein
MKSSQCRFLVFTEEIMPSEVSCIFVSEHDKIECALEQIELEKTPWKTPKELGPDNTIARPWNSLTAVSIVLYDSLSGIAQLIMGKNKNIFINSIGSAAPKDWQWGSII